MEYTTLGHTGLRVSVAGLGYGGFSQLGLGTGGSGARRAPSVPAAPRALIKGQISGVRVSRCRVEEAAAPARVAAGGRVGGEAGERPQNVAIGVEQADARDCRLRQPLLTPRLAQEIGRLEHRRGHIVLAGKDRRLPLGLHALLSVTPRVRVKPRSDQEKRHCEERSDAAISIGQGGAREAGHDRLASAARVSGAAG